MPRFAMFYRAVRDQCYLMEKPLVTPWGFRLAGNKAMARGEFEPLETELVRGLLKDVDLLVNVGANIGYYCCHALSVGKKVIAFEPIQKNVNYLCRNLRLNGWSDAEIYPIALSNKVDVLEIFGGDTGASLVKGWAAIPESYVTLVPSSTMDLVLGSRLRGKKALIVVDIEGAEKALLDGASGILANDPKPVWLIEITVTENQPKGIVVNPHLYDTFQLMCDAGYRCYAVREKLLAVTMDDVAAACKGDSTALPAHNFLFLHDE